MLEASTVRLEKLGRDTNGMALWQVTINGQRFGETVRAMNLETLANRPSCHQTGCSGCSEGYAAELALAEVSKWHAAGIFPEAEPQRHG